MEKKRTKLQCIIYAAMLSALSAVLSSWLSVSLFIGAGFTAKLSIAVVPVIFGSLTLGPLYGAGIGMVSDLLSSLILAPKGAYFPGFTLSMALMGLCYALIYKGGLTLPIKTGRLSLAICLPQFAGSVVLNTLWMIIITGIPIETLFIQRLFVQVIMCPVYIALSQALLKTYVRYFSYA